MKARDVFAAIFGSRTHRAVIADSARLSLVVLAIAGLGTLAAAPGAMAAAPVIVAGPNGEDVRYTTVHVSAELNPEDHETYWYFQWSPVGTDHGAGGEENWTSQAFNGLAANSGPTQVAEDIYNLTPSAEYEARLFTLNFVDAPVISAVTTFRMEAVTLPTPALEPAGTLSGFAIPLHGTVEADAPAGIIDEATANAYQVEWSFQCEPGCGGNVSGTIQASQVGPGEYEFPTGPVPVDGEATNLTPNQTYKVALVARNAGGLAESNETGGHKVEFTTAALPPVVSESPLWEPTQTSIQLNAVVNPHHSVLTDCHFLYGVGSMNQSAPCEAPGVDEPYVPPGNERNEIVSARLQGLEPGSEYHFKVIVASLAGSAEGQTYSFTTGQSEQVQQCPNQSIREEQHATALPDCRAYEKVSPADKNNGDVTSDAGGDTEIASADGNAIVYASKASFGDAVGAGVVGESQYLARRSPGAWVTHALDPTPNPGLAQTFKFFSNEMPLFSEDLSTGLLWAYDLPSSDSDTPNRKNIYLEETASRSLTPLTNSQAEPRAQLEFAWPGEGEYSGASADARHLLLTTETQLLPEAPAGVPNVYETGPSGLKLIDRLPDGNAPLGGAVVQPRLYRNAMSADGSRAVFLSPAGGERQLYLRIDGSRTVWVSEPENSGPGSEPQDVSFQAMTPDGRSVFFITAARLLPEDMNSGPDLYRWTYGPDPEHESNLTLISHTGQVVPEGESREENGDLTSVLGTSDDGTRVFYQSGEEERVVYWHEGFSRIIAEGMDRSNTDEGGSGGFALNGTAYGPGASRVSPDGRWLALFTRKTITDARVGESQAGREEGSTAVRPIEMYLYDTQNNTWRCVSCLEGGTSTAGISVYPAAGNGEPIDLYVGIRPNYLTNDGHVFFSSRTEGLVPSDTNGVADTYEYDPTSQVRRLLSTGRGSAPTFFTDASPDGKNVFMTTRQSLLGTDTDDLIDLYDVRVDGGFPEPAPTASSCLGEECRQAGPAPPSAPPGIASESVAGGNPKPKRHRPRRCHPTQRGTRRCHRQSAPKHHRHGARRRISNPGRTGK